MADSDISDSGARGWRKDEQIFSFNIVTSTRINAEKLIDGEPPGTMRRQWEGELDDGGIVQGEGVRKEWIP